MKKFKKFLSIALSTSLMLSLFSGFGSQRVEAASGIVRNDLGDSGLVSIAGGQITPSYDGSKLVYWTSNGDGPLRYYDVSSKTVTNFSTLAGQRHAGVRMSQDGTKVVWSRGTTFTTAGTNQTIMLYDASTGIEEKISGTDKTLGWATISPDGSKVAYLAKDPSNSNNGIIRVYDVASKTTSDLVLPTGSYNVVKSTHPQQFPTLLYTGDGKKLLISYSTNVSDRTRNVGTYLYDIASGTFNTVVSPSSTYTSTNSYKGGQGIMSTNSDGSKFVEYVNTTVSEGSGHFVVDTVTGARERLTLEETFPQYVSGDITEDGKYVTLPYRHGVFSTKTKDFINPELGMSYKYLGMSGDGSKLIALSSSTVNLNLVVYDFHSLISGDGFIAPTTSATLSLNIQSDFEPVSIEWVPNRTTSTVDIFYNGKFYETVELSKLGTTNNGAARYSAQGYPYEGTLEVKIVEKNSAGAVESAPSTIAVPDLSAKLGNINTPAGNYVDFMGSRWMVVGDNYIVRINPAATNVPYDKGGSGIFDPMNTNNIGNYLKTWFESNATPEEQSLVELHTWEVATDYNLSNSYTVRAKVGMMTSHEANALKFGKLLNITGSSNVWLMNTLSGNGYNTMTMRKEGNVIKTSNANATSTYVQTLPAVHLVPTVSVSGGSGSYSDPFKLSTDPAPQVPQVTNLKVMELRNGYINISFDPVPGASHYFAKRNGSNLGNTMNPSNMEHSGPMVAGTQYTYEISAVVNGVTGPAGTITITAPETVPVPQNVVGVSETPTSVKLTWDPVPNATDYVIKKTVSKEILGTVKSTSFEQTGLTANTEYSYFVQARINDAWSNEALVRVTTLDKMPLEAPKNFKGVSTYPNMIEMSWDAVQGADGYILKRDGVEIADLTMTTFEDVMLTPGTVYEYSLQAKRGQEVSSPSVIKVKTLLEDKLDYPTGLTVTKVTYEEVGLIWNSVDKAGSYTVLRDGVELATISDTFFTDKSVQENTDYIYSVVAKNGSISSQPAVKYVKTPSKPVVGQAPSMPGELKVTRAYADKVKLQWGTATGATYYEVYRDGNVLVYKGELTAFTDETTGPEETYVYLVVAGNDYGKTAGAPVTVTTPAEAPQIIITPATPTGEGRITFNFEVIDGAYEYRVERNPEWTYTSNGDGSYHVTYFNTVTGETRDYGNVSPENRKLPFFEDGVAPGKDYHYNITALRMSSAGVPEVIGESDVSVTTPSDGSSVTVPDSNDNGGSTPPTNPGDGGGTTPPTNPGNGETTPPTNPGNGGTTNPGTGGGGTTNPGTGGENTPSTGGNTGDGGTTPSTGGSTTTPGTDGIGTTNPGTGNEPKEEISFSDVRDNHFASEAIKALASKGVIAGYTNGTFGPNKSVSRVEFAIMLTRALGYKDSEGYKNNFKDLKESAWYYDELSVAIKNGVTKGFTDGTYRPTALIPREQAAVMVSNVLRANGFSNKGESVIFKDKGDIISWASKDVELAVENGIIKGYSNGKFLPKENMTRAETAVVIYRLLEAIK